MAKTNTTKETLVGKRFQRTGKDVFITVETEDTVRKTVIVRTQDGKTQSLSTSTLKDKRKWVEVELDTETVETDNSDTTSIEVEAEPVTDVITPITEVVTNQTTTTKEDKKKITNTDISSIVNYINSTVIALGAEIYEPVKTPNFEAFKVGGHMFATLNFSKKSVTLNCRKLAVKNVKYPDKIVNHIFDYRYTFDIMESNKELIDNLLKVSMDYQIQKNTKTTNAKKGE